jgi:transposase
LRKTRTFKATVGGLLELAEWLASFAVTLVGMEATGVYWKPVFQVLEDRFECWLLNAQHLRNVPGRKTDVKDSEWIGDPVAHGLVRPSFVPPPEIRRLRDVTRLRKAQINERTRAVQRVEKVLQDAGIKLTSVASQTYSKSARAMLDALLSGVTEPEELAELAKARLRSKIPQLREALANRFQVDHHGTWSRSCSCTSTRSIRRSPRWTRRSRRCSPRNTGLSNREPPRSPGDRKRRRI